MKKARSPESALVFDWHRREARGPWLLAFFLLTAGGIGSLFIIFRIITPETPKITSRPQQMIVLNPDVPAERALIHRAQDRSFTLVPSDSPVSQSLPPAAKLPEFQPAIRSFEMKLKSAGSQIATNDHNSLMEQDFLDALPPLPALAPKVPRKTSPPSVLKALVEEQGARALLSGADLKDIPLMDPTKPRFRVAIGSLGEVVMALPVSSSEDPAIMVKLHSAMTQLRFQPAPEKKDVEWAEVSFAWKKEAAP
ncbi:hypothetical protein [Brevifollis gellanilyticus]|uniref:TonB C-terminal domain-containing protein n=1 Tax=Brevifollis gellanilyticus TaxID=748831 RepID=A0A512M8B8_9BACT|nr:hypothetical protein [Brevifollis gellanilyticus]GEP42974.1 hypothetical protein BGE01nite_22650 [Brevifollis gellanilyticus]